jgi:hemerythrin-like domain-containing protein
MYTIIDSLHADHINFSRLLNLLDRQVLTLKEGGMPDLEIMLDTIDYLQNYADLYHHPREDLIFRYHLERSDVARAEVDELRRQHRALWESTNRVRLAIDGILHGDIVQRDVFIQQISAYVTQQMDHLNAEEGYIMPLLRQLFEVEDWEQLNRSLPYRADPLFGPTVDQQYRALYTRILNVPDAVAESGLGA